MAIVEIIENNEMQVILLPDEMRFPNGVKRVTVRKLGEDRVLSPARKYLG
jgi:antitoxin VapB